MDDNHLAGGEMLYRFDLDALSQVHPIVLILRLYPCRRRNSLDI